MKKKILFVTGTRADFGKLEPLAVELINRDYDVTFFVTGMHMLEAYGLTKLEVHRLEGAQIHEFLNQRPGDALDIILSKTVCGFSDFMSENKPDLVVVHGDRVEALACSIVCATNYVRCAHVEGGEVSGTIDESFRHCTSKMASYHFVSSEIAKSRIIRMGEMPETIFAIGSPELDVHSSSSVVSIEVVKKRYEIPFDDYGICIFHPVTSEINTLREQTSNFFQALIKTKRNFVTILPNNDPGSEIILSEIGNLPTRRFRVLPSMRFTHFSELMKRSSLIVGNSSVGVREAPFLGITSINIGTRQNDRSQAPSIIFQDAFSLEGISNAIEQNWRRIHPRDFCFGEGGSACAFADVLEGKSFWETELQKSFYSH